MPPKPNRSKLRTPKNLYIAAAAGLVLLVAVAMLPNGSADQAKTPETSQGSGQMQRAASGGGDSGDQGPVALVGEGGDKSDSKVKGVDSPASDLSDAEAKAAAAAKKRRRAARKAKEKVRKCKSGCVKRCKGAHNKAKCVGHCRRACG